MSSIAALATELRRTPLHALHLQLGAKMMAFAGYEMPVNYEHGILAEHRHCRSAAALFDVSHMGQIRLSGAESARALESMMPIDALALAEGAQRYGFLTGPSGGVLDDVMVVRPAPAADLGDLLLVVNAASKQDDLVHLQMNIAHRCNVQALVDRALLALQGPKAVTVLARLNPGVAQLRFMHSGAFALAGIDCFVTRSGYTGEDGFEISLPAQAAETLARALLGHAEVAPAGLGARDTLRLEAGLCLHGHDLHPTTTPVEAALAWAIPKVRRQGGARAGGYPGASVIDAQLASGTSNLRVGLLGLERIPVREDTEIVDHHDRRLGHVTSGTIGPSINRPVAMAYLARNHCAPSHEVYAKVRGKSLPMRVTTLPFVPHRYAK